MLVRAVMTVGGLTLISRLAGFARDLLMAALLGAGPVADAFFVALKLPNLFRRIFAEGALSVSFTPLYQGAREIEGPAAAQRFLDQTTAWLVMVLALMSVLAVTFMETVVSGLAPGFVDDPERFEPAVALARITFPYLILISVTALLGAALNAHGRFAPFAAAPLLFNGCMITALLVAPALAAEIAVALAIAVSVSGLVQLAVLALFAARQGILPRPVWPGLSARMKKLFTLMGPGALGAGAVQLNILVDMLLASLLPAGAISWLFYADRLNQLPLGVVGIAIGVALLPMLASALKRGEDARAAALTNRSAEIGLALALPAAAGLVMIAEPLIATLFQRGAFTLADAGAAADALRAYAIGIPALILVKVLATAHYAREDTVTPVIAAALGAGFNIALSILLIGPLGHVGIALATGIGAWLQAGWLARHLARRHGFRPDEGLRKRLPRLLLSLAVMTAVLWPLTALLGPIAPAGEFSRFGQLAVLLLTGGASYAGAVILLGGIDRAALLSAFRRRALDQDGAAQDKASP